jgi:DNA mismatch repair protein MutS2
LPETDGADREKKGAAGSSSLAVNAGISSPVLPLRLDLRGLRADVAIGDLAKFLDGAILGSRDEVEVIHGRGTGVLRREVHAFLKNCSAVREFCLAPEDQGGDGVTIVELK